MKKSIQHLNGIALLIIVALIFGFKLSSTFLIVQFSLALVLGYLFDLFDRVIQYLIGDAVTGQKKIDTEEIAHHVRTLSWTRVHKIVPMTQTFLFLVGYFPLVIFILSSTGSVVGMSFMLGLGIRYVVILFQDLSEGDIKKSVFFNQEGIKFSSVELTRISLGFIFSFFGLLVITWLRL